MNRETIDFHARCTQCNGRGFTYKELDIQELLTIRKECEGWSHKINFIKAVRARWEFGLKDAKDIVEATETFHSKLEELVGVDVEGDDLPW